MPLFGIDVHPRFQAGLDIEGVRRDGFDFMACKVSEGTTVYDSQDWLRRGKACGLICLGYHYLRPGNEEAQARVFVGQLTRAGVSGMLDAEAITTTGTPLLTMAGIRRFLDHCQRLGTRIAFLYLPKWYHDRLGKPSLAGLPALWASSYPSTRRGYAWDLYRAVTPARWVPYGGLAVRVLQFGDTGIVAGKHPVDVNAFLGTRTEFLELITGGDLTPEESQQLREIRADVRTFLARRADVGFARDQILTAIGVDNPENAPISRPPADNVAHVPARRTDTEEIRTVLAVIGTQLTGILARLKDIEVKVAKAP